MPSAETRRALLGRCWPNSAARGLGAEPLECRGPGGGGRGDLPGTGGSHDRTTGLEDSNHFHGPCRHQVSDVPLPAHAAESSRLHPARPMPGSSAALHRRQPVPHPGKSAEVPARPPADPGLQAGGPTSAFEMNGSGHEAGEAAPRFPASDTGSEAPGRPSGHPAPRPHPFGT